MDSIKFPQLRGLFYALNTEEITGDNMRTMNQILADIVAANNGTVTNLNNRNQLLQDWLTAIGG